MNFLTLLQYFVFGALHELSHIVAALVLYLTNYQSSYPIHQDGVTLIYQVLVGRSISLVTSESTEIIVRHTGWIFSLLLSVAIYFCDSLTVKKHVKLQSSTMKGLFQVASITAMEAIATDLFELSPTFLVPTFLKHHLPMPLGAGQRIFFCGNFGIVLLHHLWFEDRGKAALDCLEQMVNVTMVRGAQSGGIVTYHQSNKNKINKGVRTRVVNRKRTDLSKKLRRQFQKDAKLRVPKDFAPIFMQGHTRFATSSKATLEGTHPHQWTPPSYRRVYVYDKEERKDILQTIQVENFITHNGDFDFFSVNNKTYDLEIIQKWISVVTETKTPTVADSCAIAGMIDILRTKGCFGLSARYAICLGLSSSNMEEGPKGYPPYETYVKIGKVFEEVLERQLESGISLQKLGDSTTQRHTLVTVVSTLLEEKYMNLMTSLSMYLVSTKGDDEEALSKNSYFTFCLTTINAFFDNDLLMSTQIFLKHAKGSFGLCVSSSLDAHRQICMAARGQTMSVAFYPERGLICYGSEQAAVKAGLNTKIEVMNFADISRMSSLDYDLNDTRLDLDDLGGEVLLLDWDKRNRMSRVASKPNQHLPEYIFMTGTVKAILYQESKTTSLDPEIFHRMKNLSGNKMIKPLQIQENDDIVWADIQDIPKVCLDIQDDWHSSVAATSMNRLTAFHLSSCLRTRLEAHVKGIVSPQAIDVLLTGCEVSLWLAEQFASDIQKCFPKLRVQAVSSNKLLGLYGQEIAVPALGFPNSPQTGNITDSIIIIVSHSGGTFAPLACSNLFQSATKNIFAVTSEWDTQIGKQLRAMNNLTNGQDMLHHRVFSTEVGFRPAEPCSVSVVATHQLLTNLLQYISVVILSDARFRHITGAIITEEDIRVLEKCNKMNVDALSEITGSSVFGCKMDQAPKTLICLRKAGDLWAEHILENARAYILTFVYVFITVTTGWPLASALGLGLGLKLENRWGYLIRFIDSAIFFWFPQISITCIRLWQGRNLRHRMVSRTVVIGDIPWVAQSAEAFLSKIFAVSYSIAGLNVFSGNPADHFVHRFTHRVVRGTLAVFGRPDGRLSSLSTAEASVCLSMNQASSIQSLGGTCESITIGHNPFKLDLSKQGIFLKRYRPLFLCERLLVEKDSDQEGIRILSRDNATIDKINNESLSRENFFHRFWQSTTSKSKEHSQGFSDVSLNYLIDCSVSIKFHKRRSASALLGAYLNIDEDYNKNSKKIGLNTFEEDVTVDDVVAQLISSQKWSDRLYALFKSMDIDCDGLLNELEFITGITRIDPRLSHEEAEVLFHETDSGRRGTMNYNNFVKFLESTKINSVFKIPPSHRDKRGLIQIEASHERYFGQSLRKCNAAMTTKDLDLLLARSQHLIQELYETRIASLQRFVSMIVMFHRIGKQVENFFRKISFGYWGYRIDRTHSIVRIASTASPVSGADVRQRMAHLRLVKKVKHSVQVISTTYLTYKSKKINKTP